MGKWFLNLYSYFVIALFVSLAVNFYIHRDFTLSVLNSLIIFGSGLLFIPWYEEIEERDWRVALAIICLGFLPLAFFSPGHIFVSLFLLVSLIFINLGLRIKKVGIIFLILGFLTIALGELFITKIFDLSANYLITFNKDWLVFSTDLIPATIDKHRDEIYLPVLVSSVFYNKLTLSFYIFLSNIGKILSLKNLFDTLLIANLYPLVFGAYLFIRNMSKKRIYLFVYAWILITFFSIGINRSVDKFNGLYFLLPVLVLFILIGLVRINKWIYLGLLILSLIFLMTPKI